MERASHESLQSRGVAWHIAGDWSDAVADALLTLWRDEGVRTAYAQRFAFFDEVRRRA